VTGPESSGPAPPEGYLPDDKSEFLANGIRFLVDSTGEANAEEARAPRFQLDVWAFAGLTRKRALARHVWATEYERVPLGLGVVLKRLSIGDRVRVWVPKQHAQAILPGVKDSDLVVDVVRLAEPQ
jgi:hypothetical protein